MKKKKTLDGIRAVHFVSPEVVFWYIVLHDDPRRYRPRLLNFHILYRRGVGSSGRRYPLG